MPGEGWVHFEGYEGRIDPRYGGKYTSSGIRYPLIERTRRWDIVRVDTEPVAGTYRAGTYTVLSRGYDMMEKAHEEAAAYRLHFKHCAGVGVCRDIGHPGGPKRSMSQAIQGAPAVPLDDRAAATTDVVPQRSIHASEDWVQALNPSGGVVQRRVADDVEVRVIPLEFALWDGPHLSMAEDCNKRGGRVIGDAGELSCAEVEIVKRLRSAGWGAVWVQAWPCGRRSWGAYIARLADLPDAARSIQAIAGSAGGHPDVLAWKGDRVVAIESKGPTDALKQSQIEWFARALTAGVRSDDIGVVEWRPITTVASTTLGPPPDHGMLGPRFQEAVTYALELHEAQVRKATTIPYVSHLMSVCALVLEDGGTEDEAIAALLHDGPEDQGGQATLDEIRRRFGPDVAAMVHGLSGTLEDLKPAWPERKAAYLERLRGEPESVLRISLADKLHNLRSVATDLTVVGDELWSRFNADRDSQAWYYRELLTAFEARISQSRNLPEFRELVRAVFG